MCVCLGVNCKASLIAVCGERDLEESDESFSVSLKILVNACWIARILMEFSFSFSFCFCVLQ